MYTLFHQKFASSWKKEDFKSALENTSGLGITSAGFVVIKTDDIKIVDRGDGINQAIPLLLWESENCSEIVLNKPALDWLESIKKPIRVITIVGPERSGKSYLLSRMICPNLGSEGKFKLGSALHGCTQGIWIYKGETEGDIATIYLDTQGFGSLANENDLLKDQDAVLFTLAALLSSSLIYNSTGQLDRKDNNLLKLMSKYVAMVLKNECKDTQPLENEYEDIQCKPDFFWVLRDCMNTIVDEETKKKLTPFEYYKNFLMKSNISHQNIFLKSFNSVDLQVICKPSDKKEVLRNVCIHDNTKQVSEEFKTTCKDIIEAIKRQTVTKKSPTGSAINGKDFVSQLCHYVRVLNEKRNFIPTSNIWKVALNQQVLEIADQHLQQYKTEMDRLPLPVPESQLQQKHEETLQSIMKSFDKLTETYQTVYNLVIVGKDQLEAMILREPKGKNQNESALPWAYGLYPRYVTANEKESVFKIKERTKQVTDSMLRKFSIGAETCEQDVHDLFANLEKEIGMSIINGHKIDELPCVEEAFSEFWKEASKEKETFLEKINHLEKEKKAQLQLIKEQKEEEMKQQKIAEDARALAEKKLEVVKNHERLMKEKEFDFQAKMKLHAMEHNSRMKETKLRLKHAQDQQMKDQQEKFEKELKDLEMNHALAIQKMENQLQLLQDRVKYAEKAAEDAKRAAAQAATKVIYCGGGGKSKCCIQ